jgi:hypothetical protein
MNKEILKTAGLCAVAVALVLVIRDNMPKQSFSLKKTA